MNDFFTFSYSVTSIDCNVQDLPIPIATITPNSPSPNPPSIISVILSQGVFKVSLVDFVKRSTNESKYS